MWIEKKEKHLYNDSSVKGLRLHFYEGITPEEKRVCKKFCDWLRKKYWFPIRCKMTFVHTKKFRDADDGQYYYGVFYSNDDDKKRKFPCIAIAVKIENEVDEYNCLYNIAHELTHYFQWYFYYDKESSDRSLEIWANNWAKTIIWEFKNSQSVEKFKS